MAKMVTQDVHKRNTAIYLEWYEVEKLLKQHALDQLEKDGLLVSGAEFSIEVEIKQVQEGGSLPYSVNKWTARIGISQDFLVRQPEQDTPDET